MNPPVTRPICGTVQGHSRHKKLGEQRCAPCKAAAATEQRKQRAGIYKPKPAEAAQYVAEEIRHMLALNQGHGYIIRAVGYQGREHSLERLLHRYGQRNLYARLMGDQSAAA